MSRFIQKMVTGVLQDETRSRGRYSREKNLKLPLPYPRQVQI